MREILDTALQFLILILCLAIGFGTSYLLGWFFTNESNIMLWGWFAKVLFIVFGLSFSGAATSIFVK